jgi:predicted transcriptional regulator YdeE
MPPKIINQLEGFTVIGISARTNNAKEQTSDGQIGRIWQRLFDEKLLTEMLNKADQNVIAVLHRLRQRQRRRLHFHSRRKNSNGSRSP